MEWQQLQHVLDAEWATPQMVAAAAANPEQPGLPHSAVAQAAALGGRPAPGSVTLHAGLIPKEATAQCVVEKAQLAALAPPTGEPPLGQHKKLRTVSLRGNWLGSTAVPQVQAALLAVLPELRELALDNNFLPALPACVHPKLEVLSASHNRLSGIGGLQLQALRTLVLASNGPRLTGLPGAHRLPSLTSLDISGNGFASLETVAPFTRLTSLNAANNSLGSLKGIERCTALRHLDVSRNGLRYTRTAAGPNNPLRPLQALETLDVGFNDITTLAFFPGGSMGRVWRLCVAHNAFAATGPPSPAKGRPDSSGSDDAPDAPPRGVDDVGSTASRASRAPTTRSKAAASKMGATTTRTADTELAEAAATSFFARLAALFPALEALDVSENAAPFMADLDDVCCLRRCKALTELSVGPAPETPEDNAGSAVPRAVAERLPQLEVLDGVVLRARPAVAPDAFDVDPELRALLDDRTVAALSEIKRDAQRSTAPRPSSAIARRAAQGPVTDGRALQGELQDLGEIVAASHNYVAETLDRIQARVAWAYGGAPEPTAAAVYEPVHPRLSAEASDATAKAHDVAEEFRQRRQQLEADAAETAPKPAPVPVSAEEKFAALGVTRAVDAVAPDSTLSEAPSAGGCTPSPPRAEAQRRAPHRRAQGGPSPRSGSQPAPPSHGAPSVSPRLKRSGGTAVEAPQRRERPASHDAGKRLVRPATKAPPTPPGRLRALPASQSFAVEQALHREKAKADDDARHRSLLESVDTRGSLASSLRRPLGQTAPKTTASCGTGTDNGPAMSGSMFERMARGGATSTSGTDPAPDPLQAFRAVPSSAQEHTPEAAVAATASTATATPSGSAPTRVSAGTNPAPPVVPALALKAVPQSEVLVVGTDTAPDTPPGPGHMTVTYRNETNDAVVVGSDARVRGVPDAEDRGRIATSLRPTSASLRRAGPPAPGAGPGLHMPVTGGSMLRGAVTLNGTAQPGDRPGSEEASVSHSVLSVGRNPAGATQAKRAGVSRGGMSLNRRR